MLMLLMQLVGQSSISCTSDPSMPTPSRHLIEVAVDSVKGRRRWAEAAAEPS